MKSKPSGTLTHLQDDGRLRMVDVTEKAPTVRTAVASSRIEARADVIDAFLAGDLPKGDALAAARLAGIQAAKRTADWIPLCHPLPIEWVNIAFVRHERNALAIYATVRTTAKTGVEMEALTAVSAAALTLYDMGKSADKSMVVGPTRLDSKSGGKSGPYMRQQS